MMSESSVTGSSLFRTAGAAGWDGPITNASSERNNGTTVIEFILLGFQTSHNIRTLMFFLFLVVYLFTVFMNLLIITLVSTSRSLHTPMYFFLTQLSINDILLPTVIVPKMLHILLYHRGTITIIGCMTQMYFFCVSEASECLILTVMSCDRYVAICYPLRYTSIMTSTHCMTLTIACWLVAYLSMLLLIVTILKLNFCGGNIIDHFFCDTVPILELSCSDTYNFQMEIYLLGVPLILVPIIIIIFSYGRIIVTILRIPSTSGRQKAFSTCSSHLIVVSIYFWTLFGVYILPTRENTLNISKILSLLYTVFTPLINPIIYSLKNNDIRKVLHNHVYKHCR